MHVRDVRTVSAVTPAMLIAAQLRFIDVMRALTDGLNLALEQHRDWLISHSSAHDADLN